jgi:hypothetical protein
MRIVVFTIILLASNKAVPFAFYFLLNEFCCGLNELLNSFSLFCFFFHKLHNLFIEFYKTFSDRLDGVGLITVSENIQDKYIVF